MTLTRTTTTTTTFNHKDFMLQLDQELDSIILDLVEGADGHYTPEELAEIYAGSIPPETNLYDQEAEDEVYYQGFKITKLAFDIEDHISWDMPNAYYVGQALQVMEKVRRCNQEEEISPNTRDYLLSCLRNAQAAFGSVIHKLTEEGQP